MRRADIEHLSSNMFTEDELLKLATDYESKDIDFIKNLNLQWDHETDYTTFHDLPADIVHDDLICVTVSKHILQNGLIHSPNSYNAEDFWSDRFRVKIAGIVYSTLNNVPLTPPFLSSESDYDGSLHDCFFLVSGCNRFAVSFINNNDTMPLLIKKSELEHYNKLTINGITRRSSQPHTAPF